MTTFLKSMILAALLSFAFIALICDVNHVNKIVEFKLLVASKLAAIAAFAVFFLLAVRWIDGEKGTIKKMNRRIRRQLK
jgi:hypothetical protein